MAVGADGTVFVSTYAVDTDGTRSAVRIQALGPDGTPQPRWAAVAVPAGEVVGSMLAAPDGSTYAVVLPDDRATPQGTGFSVLRLDRTGANTPGWPVDFPSGALGGQLVAEGDGVCFLWLTVGATPQDVKGRTLDCLAPGGSRPSGWPIALAGAGSVLSPYTGSNGELYVTVTGNGADPLGAGRVLAFGTDGAAVPGWHQVPVAARAGLLIVPLGTTLLAEGSNYVGAGGETLSWLAPDGTPTGVTRTGRAAMGSSTRARGDDDVAYIGYYTIGGGGMTGPGLVDAIHSDGKELAGWPLKLTGWPTQIVVGSDGTIWVLEQGDPGQVAIHALGSDGKPRITEPVTVLSDDFTTIVAGVRGELYATSRTGGTTTVIALRAGS